MIATLKIVGIGLRLAWLVSVVGLLVLITAPQLLPAVDRQLYVVRGASMEPAIALGSVIIVNEVDPAQLGVGDVITFRAGSGTVVTHRVIEVEHGKELLFWTKGDASEDPDAVVVTAEALIGRVELSVPTLGQLLAHLSTPFGLISAFGLLATLLLSGWFMDELVVALRPARERRAAPSSAG